jgi:hypothetical protein
MAVSLPAAESLADPGFFPARRVFILLNCNGRAILISDEGIGVTGVLSSCGISTRFLEKGQDMSRRAKIVLISVIVLILGIEVAVRLSQNTRSGVEIVNLGDAPIEKLVVAFGGSQVGVDKVAPADSAHVWLSGAEKGTLSLSFTQTGNPQTGFLVPEFDPRSMRRDGLRLVLRIKPNEVERFMEEELPSTPLARLRDRIGDWVAAELSPLR